jgi:hypothetical protein
MADGSLPSDFDRNQGGECSIRNKMRTMAFTLYKNGWGNAPFITFSFGTVNHPTVWKKNDGIIAASTMLACAVVLNDAGVRDIRYRWSPKHWAKKAQQGLEDCFFEGKHFPTFDVPTTSYDGKAGFNEGPTYWQNTFQTFGPAAIIANNLETNLWLKDERILNICKWYDAIRLQNGQIPNYDDSYIGDVNNMQSLFGSQFDYGGTGGLSYHHPDYIVSVCQSRKYNSVLSKAPQGPITRLDHSGNIILRSTDNKGGQHYLHLLYEPLEAISRQAYTNLPIFGDAETHEHADFGSIMLAADGKWLAIDPPYMGKQASSFINKAEHHNSPSIYNTYNGNIIHPKNGYIDDSQNRPGGITLRCVIKKDMPLQLLDDTIAEIARGIDIYNTAGLVYYFVNDKLITHLDNYPSYGLSTTLNGNGSNGNGENTFIQTDNTTNATPVLGGRLYKWNHPCGSNGDSTWGLIAHTATLRNRDTIVYRTNFSDNELTVHGSGENLITKKIGRKTLESDYYGVHSRGIISQGAANTKFQTLLYPYRCKDPNLPIITRLELANHSHTMLTFLAPLDTFFDYVSLLKRSPVYTTDTIKNLHLIKGDDTTGVNLNNPFGIFGSSAVLESNAENIFMSRGSFTLERAGACAPSIIAFKQAQIQNGTQLKYDDTVYISSTNTASIQYQHDGKFRYSGYVNSAKGTVVTFFLPDVQQGYPMQAFNGNKPLVTTHLSNAPADTFKYVTVLFSAGTTKFTLQLGDPCLADCYFPPTDITIDTLFVHNNSLLQTLGHDLDIVAPHGKLVLTKQSKMSICPDFVLVNKDTLVLADTMCLAPKKIINDGQVDYQPGFEVMRTSYLNGTGDFTNRNVIVVNDKAGLVLDSGSYTQVGTISTLLIRKGGTLLVKKGATLVIGNMCDVDRGELIAEDGAFVCIEDSADIHFFNDIDSASFALGKDTVDRHIAYFSKNAQQPAIAHVNELGGRGKFKKSTVTSDVPNDEGKWASNNCIPFCELKFKNGPDGINNKPFGWSNISYPRSTFKLNVDTICLNRQILLWAKKSLNETNYKIDICTYDTASKQCVTAVHTQTGVANDNIRLSDGMYVYTTEYTGTHQVRLIVGNDCGERDTSYQYFYVAPSPTVLFTLSDTAICPGKGVLTANGKMSHSGILKQRHEWTVSELADSLADEETEFDSQTWTFDHAFAIDSLFGFDGFEFKGGKQYVVSLTVVGRCETITYEDTVVVPLKVNIDIVTAQVYNNPVGPAAIKLLGTAQHATSWSWNPTDYLSSPDSLNPVATPQEPITYFLTGELDGCTATDSVQIKHNAFAFAGNNRNVCVNQNILLGTSYNSALFLGLMMYSNVQDNIIDYKDYNQNQQIDFTKYFTHFMLTQNRMHENTYLGLFFSDSVRNNIIARPWFANYYEQFLSTQGDLSSLAYFSAALSSDSSLNYLAESFRFKNSFLNDLFFDYRKYFVNHEFERFNIIWETKYPQDSIWTAINDWDNYFTINQVIETSKQYRITLFDKKESSVEYDEITITVDTAILPLYTPTYQVDSTVYFTNYSQPINQYTTYAWNFGDGSTSTVKNPNHTFAAFDSSYIVCLAVNNNCGVYQYCDTVRVDSMGLFISSFNKTGPTKEQEIPNIVNTTQAKDVLVTKTTKDIWLDNIPNPFSELTTISYIVGKDYQEAELRITDVLGRVVKVYPLKSNQGQLEFDGSLYKRGLYYSILVVDDAIVKSKTMLIER